MILLFAGPSLHGLSALPREITLRPPAAAGDIHRAIAQRPHAIALVDGVFATTRAVWHKEILDALDEGIAVLGAASLGALRAAELHMFGMEGVGAVFQAYRDGHETRDDAVLVSHAPAELGYRPLSLALIDAEHSIRRAALAPADRAALLKIARGMPFYARSWEAILETHGEPARLRRLLAPHLASLKQADTLALLIRLTQPITAPAAWNQPRLVQTSHYAALKASSS